jgi:hypothetical protein
MFIGFIFSMFTDIALSQTACVVAGSPVQVEMVHLVHIIGKLSAGEGSAMRVCGGAVRVPIFGPVHR